MKKIISILILLCTLHSPFAWAQAFVVQRIELQGLQRVSAETVYRYLPINRGQRFTHEKSTAILNALYKTGFFDHITLSRDGNTLIIQVVERATIGQLKLTGNSLIPTDKLLSVMRSMEIAEGRVYNPLVIDRIRHSLLNQYYEVGRYNARVDVTVTPMERNRVLLKIDISEGLVAKIQRINIIGNHTFSERRLKKELTLTTSGLITFITQTDRFVQERLEESLERLRNFYLDHGYLQFAIRSTHVAITPDRKSIYLTIVINEGEPYTVEGVDVTGDLILTKEETLQRLNIKCGEIFSRKAIMAGEKTVNDALGEKGYIYSMVSLNPKVNENARTVFLVFEVKPGKRTYIRYIHFSDNTKTNDVVFRREMQQMEAAPASTTKLELSKHRMSLLPYVKDVQMTVQPVEGFDDLVDVNYRVKEENTAKANVSIGYSQANRAQFSAGLNQNNFLGTGNTLGLSFTKNRYEQYYGLNYIDPYYTPDGISRAFNLSALRVTPGKANASNSYTMNQYSASVLYSIPVFQEKNAFSRVQLGYGYEDTLIHLNNPNVVSLQVQDFVNQHGRHFGQINLLAGLSRDSRDRALFPTRGSLQTIGLNVFAPVIGGLSFFTSAYTGRVYYPLTSNFIVTLKGQAAYGNSIKGGSEDFPFYKYFYAGGIDSVRGYLGNTLGPRDSQNKPTGGNALATGSVALIFPNYLSDNLRTSVFFDAGNVYTTFNNKKYNGTGSGPVRMSVGIGASWLTMFGLIDLSYAKPLNPQRRPGPDGKETEPFQLNLGANFG